MNHISPAAFVTECSRRGITLTATPTGSIKYRAPGSLPPKVLDTIRSHKAEIIEALRSPVRESENPGTANGNFADFADALRGRTHEATEPATYDLPDGRKLYEDAAGLWGYVPPGANPAAYISNFPPSMQGVARRMYGGYSTKNKANEKL